jgi:DNA-binding response OmpR family regulator
MGTHRILVVEDDHGLRDLLARGLRARDFDVMTAADGRAALRSVNPPPDAVVLDIGLPDADGRDVCAAMRTRGIDAPVIFLTARHDVNDRLAGFASVGDDYLPKPFAFPELVARLTALLRRRVVPERPVPGHDRRRRRLPHHQPRRSHREIIRHLVTA